MVGILNEGLGRYDFLTVPKGRLNCDSTYYIYPLRYDPELAGVARNDFVTALNAEGMQFYQGYVRPLYYHPLFQERRIFKNGYPFSAKENSGCNISYSPGTCPTALALQFDQTKSLQIACHLCPRKQTNFE